VSAEHVSGQAEPAQPQAVHLRARRAGDRGGCATLHRRPAPDAYRRGRRPGRLRRRVRAHDGRGARCRGTDGHGRGRRRRRAARVPRRVGRPLRARHRRRRHDPQRRHRQGAGARLGRGSWSGRRSRAPSRRPATGITGAARRTTRTCRGAPASRSAPSAPSSRSCTGPSTMADGSMNLMGRCGGPWRTSGYSDLKESSGSRSWSRPAGPPVGGGPLASAAARLPRMSRPRVFSGIQPLRFRSYRYYLGALRQWGGAAGDSRHRLLRGRPARHHAAAASPPTCGAGPGSRPPSCSPPAGPAAVHRLRAEATSPSTRNWPGCCRASPGSARPAGWSSFKDKAGQGRRGRGQRRAVHLPGPAGRRHPAVRHRPGSGRGGQRQHLELTGQSLSGSTTGSGRPSSSRRAYIRPAVARIADLQDPTIKMSKSASSPQGIIDVLEGRRPSARRSCVR